MTDRIATFHDDTLGTDDGDWKTRAEIEAGRALILKSRSMRIKCRVRNIIHQSSLIYPEPEDE